MFNNTFFELPNFYEQVEQWWEIHTASKGRSNFFTTLFQEVLEENTSQTMEALVEEKNN